MILSTYIQSIITETQPGVAFFYNRNDDFNINGDNAASPCVLAIFPDTFNYNVSALTGNIKDGYNLFIRFLEHLPNITEQVGYYNDAIERQKVNAYTFLNQLSNDDEMMDLQNPIQAIPVIEAYDGNWFGVELQIKNMQFIQPIQICP